ncbi:MAG: hypothetical protein JWL97_3932 [Gemmatimonadales bacterium]|nr:hypothetical protein [Gemmatimonadales bacterium]
MVFFDVDGTLDDIDALNQKITHLEQHTIDLRLQLEEQGEDLAAARATNREFIAQLNSLHPTTRTKGRQ